MNGKTIYLIISICVVVLLFSVPPYSVLFDTTLIHPPSSYSEQMGRLDAEDRRVFRYGNSYSFFVKVEQALENGHIQDPVILLPPQSYLNEMGVEGVTMVEPAEFYYYTGHKAVWANSPDADKATWTFIPRKPEVVLKQIESKEQLQQLLTLYKPYLHK